MTFIFVNQKSLKPGFRYTITIWKFVCGYSEFTMVSEVEKKVFFCGTMYILYLKFAKKLINMYLKPEIVVVYREFLAFEYVSIVFRNKTDDYLYLFIRNLENLNIHLYLCWQVENTKWILYCRKMVLNVGIKVFWTNTSSWSNKESLKK